LRTQHDLTGYTQDGLLWRSIDQRYLATHIEDVSPGQKPVTGSVIPYFTPAPLFRLGCPVQADAAQQEAARIHLAVAAASEQQREIADRNKRPQ